MILYHLIEKLWSTVIYGMKHSTLRSQEADWKIYLLAILLFGC